LTALFEIDHARTLAIIAPRLYENQLVNKKEKLIQYGSRVFGMDKNDDETAIKSIQKTESFFQSLGIPTKVSDYTTETSNLPHAIKQIFIDRGWIAMGERQAITPEDVELIVQNAI